MSVKSRVKNFLANLLYWILKSPEYNEVCMSKLKSEFKSLGKNPKIFETAHIKNPQYISIGNDFQSMYNLRLEAWDYYIGQNFKPQIIIGNNVSMNTDIHIACIDEINIADNVMMASRVYISDHSHGDSTLESLSTIANRRPLTSKGPVVIEKNVWIGEGACILSGVTVGENSIIGANAVVTKSFPKNSIIAGVPARIIKQLP